MVHRISLFIRGLSAGAAPLLIGSAIAAAPPPQLPGSPLSYADAVDLALAAPVVAHVTITEADRLKPADAPDLSPGTARVYIAAHVDTLVRGPALPESVSYLADVPLDDRGRLPRLKGADALVFASSGSTTPGELRLIAPDANRPWDAATEQRVHTVLAQALGPSAPPRVTGIGNVFHVAGSLPGESETQIFVRTADKRPISLAVERRPDQQPSWAVALGDMIDEAAAPPPRDSLLWYQLACGLPHQLPARSIAQLAPEDAAAAAQDYRVVLDGLGPCGRTRGRPGQPPTGSDESVTPTASQSG